MFRFTLEKKWQSCTISYMSQIYTNNIIIVGRQKIAKFYKNDYIHISDLLLKN